ncbi:MAG: ubiquitin-like protein [Bacteroidota bacterium]
MQKSNLLFILSLICLPILVGQDDAPSNNNQQEISIESLPYGNFKLNLDKKTTIGQLKQKISKKTNTSVLEQRLLYKDEEGKNQFLDEKVDEKTLQFYLNKNITKFVVAYNPKWKNKLVELKIKNITSENNSDGKITVKAGATADELKAVVIEQLSLKNQSVRTIKLESEESKEELVSDLGAKKNPTVADYQLQNGSTILLTTAETIPVYFIPIQESDLGKKVTSTALDFTIIQESNYSVGGLTTFLYPKVGIESIKEHVAIPVAANNTIQESKIWKKGEENMIRWKTWKGLQQDGKVTLGIIENRPKKLIVRKISRAGKKEASYTLNDLSGFTKVKDITKKLVQQNALFTGSLFLGDSELDHEKNFYQNTVLTFPNQAEEVVLTWKDYEKNIQIEWTKSGTNKKAVIRMGIDPTKTIAGLKQIIAENSSLGNIPVEEQIIAYQKKDGGFVTIEKDDQTLQNFTKQDFFTFQVESELVTLTIKYIKIDQEESTKILIGKDATMPFLKELIIDQLELSEDQSFNLRVGDEFLEDNQKPIRDWYKKEQTITLTKPIKIEVKSSLGLDISVDLTDWASLHDLLDQIKQKTGIEKDDLVLYYQNKKIEKTASSLLYQLDIHNLATIHVVPSTWDIYVSEKTMDNNTGRKILIKQISVLDSISKIQQKLAHETGKSFTGSLFFNAEELKEPNKALYEYQIKKDSALEWRVTKKPDVGSSLPKWIIVGAIIIMGGIVVAKFLFSTQKNDQGKSIDQ